MKKIVIGFAIAGFLNTFIVLAIAYLVGLTPPSVERLVFWDYVYTILCPTSIGSMAIDRPHSLIYVAGTWLMFAFENVVVYGVVGLFFGVVWKLATRARGRSQVT